MYRVLSVPGNAHSLLLRKRQKLANPHPNHNHGLKYSHIISKFAGVNVKGKWPGATSKGGGCPDPMYTTTHKRAEQTRPVNCRWRNYVKYLLLRRWSTDTGMTAVYYRIDFTDSATNSRTYFAHRFLVPSLFKRIGQGPIIVKRRGVGVGSVYRNNTSPIGKSPRSRERKGCKSFFLCFQCLRVILSCSSKLITLAHRQVDKWTMEGCESLMWLQDVLSRCSKLADAAGDDDDDDDDASLRLLPTAR